MSTCLDLRNCNGLNKFLALYVYYDTLVDKESYVFAIVKILMIQSHHSKNIFCLVAACVYNGQRYSSGQSWQDGCDKNCTCRDANLGYYQCDEL